MRPDGYVTVPRGGKHVLEHHVVVQQVIGKPLPPGAVVHHINGNPSDNRPANLVVCEDSTYHKLLHRRERALRASGHADWLQCNMCHRHDDPRRMYVKPGRFNGYHRECRRQRDGELGQNGDR